MMVNTIGAFIGRRDDNGDSLPLGAAQPGRAKHDGHIQIEMIRHGLRVEAMDLEDI